MAKKIKVIFDSNIYDSMVEGKLDITILEKNKKRYEFYITHVQVDEINKCPDSEKREKLLLCKKKISPIIVPTESVVCGVSRYGGAKLGDGKILEKLRKGNSKNTEDALIGETAINNKFILVTNDKRLRKKVNSCGGKAISLSKFKKSLK